MLEPDALGEPAPQRRLEALASEGAPLRRLLEEGEEAGQAGEPEIDEEPVVVGRVGALCGQHPPVLGQRLEQFPLLVSREQAGAGAGAQHVGEKRGPVADDLVRPRLLRGLGLAARVVGDPVEGDRHRLVEILLVAARRVARQQRGQKAQLVQVLAVALGPERVGMPVDRSRQLGRLRAEDVEAALAGRLDPPRAHGRQRDRRRRWAGRRGQRLEAAQPHPAVVRGGWSVGAAGDGEQRQRESGCGEAMHQVHPSLRDHHPAFHG